MILPLERLLQQLASEKRGEFPDPATNYWTVYELAKTRLDQKYFSNTSAGLAMKGGRFTKHDISHVNDVITSAGHLIGVNDSLDSSASEQLNGYEVFVLLLSILLHDAGNALGREDHEKRAGEIAKEFDDILSMSSIERRLVSSIAEAHGGSMPDGDKNTIGRSLKRGRADINNVKVYPRRLAAILKLADELSENPRRADHVVLETGSPASAVVHHLYCQLINVTIDFEGRAIKLDFDLPKSLLSSQYPLSDTEDVGGPCTYLIDYIAERIEKTDAERQYCNRFLAEFSAYEHIRVNLTIHDDQDERVVDELSLEIEDAGYPTTRVPIKCLNESFDGELMQLKHSATAKLGVK